MSDSTPSLEDLVERRQPSALARHDAALLAAGVSAAEIGAARDALALLAVSDVRSERPAGSLRDRLFASRTRGGKFGIFADRIARLFDLSVEDAASLLARIEEPGSLIPFLGEGLELMQVNAGPRCEGALCTIVRIQPGASFPEHAHKGDETMVVLDGGFHEPAAGGEEVWRGEELYRHDGTEHTIVALPGVPCIAAVVIYGYADLK